jgi:hypothetical protein
MSDVDRGLQFTWADVEKWVTDGLLTEDQAVAIREYVALGDSVTKPANATQEQRPGLNLITLAYYFGGFMILLAYTFFVGLQWQSLSRPGQLAIAAGTVGVLWGLSYWLRRTGLPLAGGLLLFAGTGIVPLVVYTGLRLAGLWPDQPGYDDLAYQDFYQLVKPAWVTMEVVSLLVATFVIWRVRFPLITLLIAFWVWYLSMDLTRWVFQNGDQTYDDLEQFMSLAIGFGLVVLGVVLQRRTRQDYSRWFYIFGHVIILGNFGALAYDKQGVIGLLFLAMYLVFVVASVWLQRPVFVVFGALGCYSYASYLAFQVFNGALGFVFALAIIGLVIVLSAVGYQKYARPWLTQRLHPAPLPPLDEARVV